MLTDYQLRTIVDNQKAEIDKLSRERDEANFYNASLLEENNRLAKMFSFAGLSPEELKGIHKLIQKQIAFISKMQTGNDTHEVYTAVDALVSLASLVSKPTD